MDKLKRDYWIDNIIIFLPMIIALFFILTNHHTLYYISLGVQLGVLYMLIVESLKNA